MSESVFHFKQFSIQQTNAPLKVTTDACLFGALVECENATSVLDIGTGTGLLALMIAQRSNAAITGIEIDVQSALIAKNNFDCSPWKQRLKVIQSDINEWSKSASEKFDLIVCNPPFFTSSMKNSDQRKSMARHNDSLSLESLRKIISSHLNSSGCAYIMLPPAEMNRFEILCQENNLFANKKYFISSSPEKIPYLNIFSFSFQQIKIHEETVFVYNSPENYSAQFRELLSGYYLHL